MAQNPNAPLLTGVQGWREVTGVVFQDIVYSDLNPGGTPDSAAWNFDDRTQMNNPGTGNYRMNSSSPKDVNEAVLSKTDADGNSIELLTPGDTLNFAATAGATSNNTYIIVGTPVDRGNWQELTLAYLAGNDSSPDDGVRVDVTRTPSAETGRVIPYPILPPYPRQSEVVEVLYEQASNVLYIRTRPSPGAQPDTLVAHPWSIIKEVNHVGY